VPFTGKKSDLVLDLCKLFGANQYLSGVLGKDYLDEDSFSISGIQIDYQAFRYPTYPQLWGDFEPNLSIIDYWMNYGTGSGQFINGSGHGI
jgi:hypothetical protein